MDKIVIPDELFKMYSEGMSLTDVCSSPQGKGVSISTLRSRLKESGILRGRADSVRLASAKGKFSNRRGRKITFTEEWKQNISKARLSYAENHSKNLSKKPNGYMEFTRGPNKGRTEHVVVMEKIIGRRLYANEQVHHINHVRHDNRPENLQLLTRSEHMRLHATINAPKRKRLPDGTFS